MTEPGFEITEHTSEIGFTAHGRDLAEAFEEAGKAVFEIMTDIDALEATTDTEFSIESESLEALLFDYVDELNYIAQADGLLLKEFHVSVAQHGEEYMLKCRAAGQHIADGMRLQEIKAPTYSEMEITEDDNEWSVQMVLDV